MKRPSLQRGDITTCLARNADVIVTSWSSGHIPWPRCRTVGQRGGSGLLVDEELARAIRTESAAAVGYWWGVTQGVVVRWRKALDVTRTNNPATHILIKCAAEVGAEASRKRGVTAEEREQRRQNERRHNLRQHLRPGGGRPLWAPKQLHLLGTQPDDVVARRIGRTTEAMRLKRQKLGIPNPVDWRRRKA